MGIILHNCSDSVGWGPQSRVITYFFLYFWVHHEKQNLSAFHFNAPTTCTMYF